MIRRIYEHRIPKINNCTFQHRQYIHKSLEHNDKMSSYDHYAEYGTAVTPKTRCKIRRERIHNWTHSMFNLNLPIGNQPIHSTYGRLENRFFNFLYVHRILLTRFIRSNLPFNESIQYLEFTNKYAHILAV